MSTRKGTPNKRKAPTLADLPPRDALPASITDAPDEWVDELSTQEDMRDVCAMALDREPKMSARQLCALCQELGLSDTTQAQCKRYRDTWVENGRPRRAQPERAERRATDGEGAQEDQRDVLALLRQRLAAGDAAGALEWARVAKALGVDVTQGEGPSGGAGDADMSRLSDTELQCYRALETVALGGTLLAEQRWFVELLARVPPARRKVHPAHVPLPQGSPHGTVLEVPTLGQGGED